MLLYPFFGKNLGINREGLVASFRQDSFFLAGRLFFNPETSFPARTKGILAKNGLLVFPTIFTSAAGFLLASRDKKVTHITQRFFWRQREDTPVVYIRDNTRVHPSSQSKTH
jgi:hypothetical protein